MGERSAGVLEAVVYSRAAVHLLAARTAIARTRGVFPFARGPIYRPSGGAPTRVAFRLFTILTILAALAGVFFLGKVRERDRVLDRFLAETVGSAAPRDTDAVVMTLSRAIFARTNHGVPASRLPFYERIESTSFFNVTTAVSLEYGIYGITGHSVYGPCGTMTRTLLVALWRLGIPARKLQLLGDPGTREAGSHAMVEYRSRGRWRVISPSDSSFVWRAADGEVATLDDIRADSTIFRQVFGQFPGYPGRFDQASHIRWEKLPPPVRAVLRIILGDSGYQNAYTPSLYDQPRHLLVLLSGAGVLFFGILSLGAYRLERRSGVEG